MILTDRRSETGVPLERTMQDSIYKRMVLVNKYVGTSYKDNWITPKELLAEINNNFREELNIWMSQVDNNSIRIFVAKYGEVVQNIG